MINILLIGISAQDQEKFDLCLQKNFQLQANYVTWAETDIDLVITGSIFLTSDELRSKLDIFSKKLLTLSSTSDELDYSKRLEIPSLLKHNYTDVEFIEWLSSIELKALSPEISEETPDDSTSDSFLKFFLKVFKKKNNFYINGNYCEIKHETMTIISNTIKPNKIDSFAETEKKLHLIQEYEYSIIDFLYNLLIDDIDNINYVNWLDCEKCYIIKSWPPFINTNKIEHLNLFLEMTSLLQKNSLNINEVIELTQIETQKANTIKLFFILLQRLNYLE